VGRYFMEHVEMPGAQLVLAEPRPLTLYMHTFFETKARGEVALTPEVQRTHEILNGTASLNPGVYDELRGTFQQFTPERVEQTLQLSPEEMERRRARSQQDTSRQRSFPARRAFKLFTRQEQAPNPHSRVTLIDETDALGMPRVALDWQLTELDKRSMRTFYEVLGQEAGRSGLGRVRLLEWLRDDDAGWPDFVSGGWHHMGTARMHDDPRQGVVDPDGKVHGLDNLYVAGSAVYPTAGAANPTLTLIALTLRLSGHLKAMVD
jgi:choline dehydrogenase-like flavoprotein